METNVRTRTFEPAGGQAPDRKDDCADGGRSLVGRIAAIMDSFDQQDPVLSLVELSRRSGLPKSTAHRLAEQLRAMGWLERCHSGYRVGMRLFELGGLAAKQAQLRDPALPHLHALAGQTGLAVQLAVLDSDEVVYLDRVTVGSYRLPTRQGGRMPAYCTGLGKAMLAFDDAAAQRVAESELPARTAHTIDSPASLRAELERVRSTGVAFDRQESYDGLGCVAAPIRNSGRAIGAVSVTGPINRIDWDSLSTAVRVTATRIWNDRFPPSPAHASN
ncbi:MAG TPA: IclR family transcriptional regulator [Microthrixaceae bacterium]|nr:IclR family transcriptional regulator [Microthrixaceae bacterium]